MERKIIKKKKKKDAERDTTTQLVCLLVAWSSSPVFLFHVCEHIYTMSENANANLIEKYYAGTPKIIPLEGK